jgi:hypothetical protein
LNRFFKEAIYEENCGKCYVDPGWRGTGGYPDKDGFGAGFPYFGVRYDHRLHGIALFVAGRRFFLTFIPPDKYVFNSTTLIGVKLISVALEFLKYRQGVWRNTI